MLKLCSKNVTLLSITSLQQHEEITRADWIWNKLWTLPLFLGEDAKGHKQSFFIASQHQRLLSLALTQLLACRFVVILLRQTLEETAEEHQVPVCVCVICGCDRSTHKQADSHITKHISTYDTLLTAVQRCTPQHRLASSCHILHENRS